MRFPTFIMLHHSLTKDGDTVSWQAIRRFHIEKQGWNDIGYHAGIEQVNGRPEAFYGRPWSMKAAACKEADMNDLALHLCIVGNFDLMPPSLETLNFAVRTVIKPWMETFGIPTTRIVGHHDYAGYKTCPGTMFDLAEFRRLAAA